MKMVVKFEYEKETSGAHRYMEVDKSGNRLTASDGAKVGSLYIRKSAIKDAPDKLTVTITD